MSVINGLVRQTIYDYHSSRVKEMAVGSITKPPAPVFTKKDLDTIGRLIISELEGYLSDMMLKPYIKYGQ
ncbi:MAG: hypothetical protein NG712_06045 [Omnitrophica bacterium]|nr:hypothetical protein [Candidatus Omnitrophota bacterium]